MVKLENYKINPFDKLRINAEQRRSIKIGKVVKPGFFGCLLVRRSFSEGGGS